MYNGHPGNIATLTTCINDFDGNGVLSWVYAIYPMHHGNTWKRLGIYWNICVDAL